MNDTKQSVQTQARVRRTSKGCMHLAPGGEKRMMLLSAIGWLTILVRFSIV